MPPPTPPSSTNGYRLKYYEDILGQIDDGPIKNAIQALVSDFGEHGKYHRANETRWGPLAWIRGNPIKAIAIFGAVNMWFVSDLRDPIIAMIARVILGAISGGAGG